jgi:hypothetical protein
VRNFKIEHKEGMLTVNNFLDMVKKPHKERRGTTVLIVVWIIRAEETTRDVCVYKSSVNI